jgi:hypothetical protein
LVTGDRCLVRGPDPGGRFAAGVREADLVLRKVAAVLAQTVCDDEASHDRPVTMHRLLAPAGLDER